MLHQRCLARSVFSHKTIDDPFGICMFCHTLPQNRKESGYKKVKDFVKVKGAGRLYL